MPLKVALASFALLLAMLVGDARGHHSTAVNFDSSKEITIDGVVTEVRWLNPHSRFRVNVKADDGQTREWLVEMGAANTMRRAGFPMDRFAVGDRLKLTGAAGRRDRAILLRAVVLSDGTELTPDMRPRTRDREASAN